MLIFHLFHFYFIDFFCFFLLCLSQTEFPFGNYAVVRNFNDFFPLSYLPQSTNMQSKEDGFLPSFMI